MGYAESEELVIDGHRLVLTSLACPEQYDVFNSNNVQVGYLRLRNGYFRAEVPDCGGETVYDANTTGDGMFDDDERMPHLTAAVAAVAAYWKKLMEAGT